MRDVDVQKDRWPHTQTNRPIKNSNKYRQAQTDRQTDRQTYTLTHWQTDRHQDRQTSRQTDRQIDRQAGRQTGIKADRQEDEKSQWLWRNEKEWVTGGKRGRGGEKDSIKLRKDSDYISRHHQICLTVCLSVFLSVFTPVGCLSLCLFIYFLVLNCTALYCALPGGEVLEMRIVHVCLLHKGEISGD